MVKARTPNGDAPQTSKEGLQTLIRPEPAAIQTIQAIREGGTGHTGSPPLTEEGSCRGPLAKKMAANPCESLARRAKCPTPQRGCVGPRVETANLVGYQVYHRRRLGSRFKANWFARSPFVRHLDSFQYVGVGTMNWDATLTLDSRDE